MAGEGLGQARTCRDGTRKCEEEREQGEHAQADKEKEYPAVIEPKLETTACLSHGFVNRSSSKERWTVVNVEKSSDTQIRYNG